MSTEVATRTPAQELVAQVRSDTFKEQVGLALPSNVHPDRFVRATVTALMQNPDIVRAERDSLLQSVIRCAQDGLLPDGREAALVMFGQKAVYMPMIGGFRKIAAEHGWTLRTAVVHEEDEFDFELGMEPTLSHKPVRPGMERGPMIAAYAVATHAEHPKEIEVMYAQDIAKAREVSKAKDSGPWRDWPERMWEKTAGRRLFAKLPLGERDQERVARVLSHDDLGPGEAARLLYGPTTHELEAGSTSDDGAAVEVEPDADGKESASPEAEVSPDSEASASPPASPSEPEPEPEVTFAQPANVATDDPIVLAANAAGEVEIPKGTNAGKKLRELLDAKDGLNWLRYALRNWNDDEFGKACWAFARIYAPDIFQQVLAEKETAAGS